MDVSLPPVLCVHFSSCPHSLILEFSGGGGGGGYNDRGGGGGGYNDRGGGGEVFRRCPRYCCEFNLSSCCFPLLPIPRPGGYGGGGGGGYGGGGGGGYGEPRVDSLRHETTCLFQN